MKDSSVDPAGLFDPRRQKRLLDGLAQRCQSCITEQQRLSQRHDSERNQEEQSLASTRDQTTDECRKQRREMLQEWDESEEKLTAAYEAKALKTRSDLNRLAAVFRKKISEEKLGIERKVKARKEAVQFQYDSRKNQPHEQQAKENDDIETAVMGMAEDIEWARALTIRRLDRLPEVPPAESPEENMRAKTPQSVQEAIDTIYSLNRKCKKSTAEMQEGMASKIVDSFYLPAGVAVFLVFWAVGALVFGPQPPWMWMALGVPVAGVLGFTIYLILLWPLKKMTRRLYPQVERIREAAEECAASGRKISEQIQKETSKELSDRRKAHLKAAATWKTEQTAAVESKLNSEQAEAREKLTTALAEVDEVYVKEYEEVSTSMHVRADALAIQITDTLSQSAEQIEMRRKASDQARQQQFERLTERLKTGLSSGIDRMTSAAVTVQERFPDWQQINELESSAQAKLDYLPIGSLMVGDTIRDTLSSSAGENGQASGSEASKILAAAEIPETLPIVLHRRLHSGLVISAPDSQMEKAIDVARQVIWRLMTSISASRAKLTLIDPLGRGQHFTSFMALGDHDPAIVGHRVWTDEANIDARLGELGHHVEDVLQATLRDQFQRIEDYNELAGSMAEPYRIVASVGFPEGLTRSSYKHLLALIESGLRCGVFTVMVVDQDKTWPGDMPMPGSDKLLRLNVDESGQWSVGMDELKGIPFKPLAPPPTNIRSQLIDKIGKAAVAASKVEIPLKNILDKETEAEGSTDHGIEIVVGSQGANRNVALELGKGVRQHVLIAGKTGSGKSTLLHSIITSGAFHYTPEQLHFYLLDFKKGVEFKPYADQGLPHARVIGIESEREFGRSVLQRLDAELQERGEKFRGYGVQELAEYRGMRGDELPRIMLIVDEFQEIFVRDDRLAGDCAMLLDRLVRQGRSFGIHVILSSQSLAGAYSLPRATLGQMAVRIAMQCSESDAALILADDNTGARLISRPGEAIYNDAGGLVEGNRPFQAAWLSSEDHQALLTRIVRRDDKFAANYTPPVIFEGNRPSRWSGPLSDLAIAGESPTTALRGLLGEAVEIGPPATIELSRNTGRNALLITPPEAKAGLIGSTLSTFARSHSKLDVIYFDGSRGDVPSLAPWLEDAGLNTRVVKPRDSEAEMAALSKLIKERGDDAPDQKPIVAVIDPLDRFRDFRQEDTFNFSLDSAGVDGESGAAALCSVLRDGPNANVFVILVCNGAETMSRWLPRASQHDLELRLLGRMNAADSSSLVDSPIASELTAATTLLYDDADGSIIKFRQCELPDAADVRRWLGS